MGRRTSTERVAHLLLELHIRVGDIGLTVEPSMQLPPTRTVLADALGMTPVHINRVLQTLHRQGVVELQRHAEDPPAAGAGPDCGLNDTYLHRYRRKPRLVDFA